MACAAANPVVPQVSREFPLAPLTVLRHRVENSEWGVVQYGLVSAHEAVKQPARKAASQLPATLRAPFLGPSSVCCRSFAHAANLPAGTIFASTNWSAKAGPAATVESPDSLGGLL